MNKSHAQQLKFLFLLGMTCFAWNNANNNVLDGTRDRRDMEVAGTLGVMSIITGLLYLADFFYVMYQNALLGTY